MAKYGTTPLADLVGPQGAQGPTGSTGSTGSTGATGSPGPTDGLINVKAAPYNAVGNGVTDDTTAIQAALTASLTSGSRLVFPEGTFMVSSLTLDYSAVTAQASSGAPYGFQAPMIEGIGKRRSVIQQIAGSTGVILTIKGKTSTNAGPGTNNKVTGLGLRNLELIGQGSGSHGLFLESVNDCSFENLLIRSCGGSGVYIARETFVAGVNDEYAYGLDFRNVKMLVNARYGMEHSGTNAISGTMTNCDATGNTLGGYYLAPTNWSMFGCVAIGNGTGSSTRYGLLAVRNSNLSSTNNTLLLSGCRFEGNSAVGGYDVRIDAGFGHVLQGCTFYSTTGAHSVGIGLNAVGSASFVQSPLILGGYFSGDSVTTTARAIVTGSDCRNLLVLNPRIDYTLYGTGGNNTPSSIITDNGATTSFLHSQNMQFSAFGWMDFTREIVTPGASPANGARVYIKDDGSDKTQLAVKFQSGSELILATEGNASTSTYHPFLLMGV